MQQINRIDRNELAHILRRDPTAGEVAHAGSWESDEAADVYRSLVPAEAKCMLVINSQGLLAHKLRSGEGQTSVSFTGVGAGTRRSRPYEGEKVVFGGVGPSARAVFGPRKPTCVVTLPAPPSVVAGGAAEQVSSPRSAGGLSTGQMGALLFAFQGLDLASHSHASRVLAVVPGEQLNKSGVGAAVELLLARRLVESVTYMSSDGPLAGAALFLLSVIPRRKREKVGFYVGTCLSDDIAPAGFTRNLIGYFSYEVSEQTMASFSRTSVEDYFLGSRSKLLRLDCMPLEVFSGLSSCVLGSPGPASEARAVMVVNPRDFSGGELVPDTGRYVPEPLNADDRTYLRDLDILIPRASNNFSPYIIPEGCLSGQRKAVATLYCLVVRCDDPSTADYYAALLASENGLCKLAAKGRDGVNYMSVRAVRALRFPARGSDDIARFSSQLASLRHEAARLSNELDDIRKPRRGMRFRSPC